MIAPTVHLNGTSRSELLRQLADAGAAVRTALDRLRDAAPNGRDYHDRPGALGAAIREHDDRAARLQSVLDEINQIAEAVANAD